MRKREREKGGQKQRHKTKVVLRNKVTGIC